MPTLVHASEVLNSKTAHQCKLAGKRKAGRSLCKFPALPALNLAIAFYAPSSRAREREIERESVNMSSGLT